MRLPSAHGEFCRVELRGPDPAGNPYLVIGLILAAGLDGIEHSLPLPEAVNRNLFHPSAAAGLDSLPRTLREAITVAGQSEFISRELPVALMNKYFEYQTQLCHDAEGAPDTESWERAHSFLIIGFYGSTQGSLSESFIVNYQEGRAAYGKSPDRFSGE